MVNNKNENRYCKYVIVDGMYPILFSSSVSHHKVAEGLNVTSAGFYCKEARECCGFSDSLQLGPSVNDKFIIERLLFSRDVVV